MEINSKMVGKAFLSIMMIILIISMCYRLFNNVDFALGFCSAFGIYSYYYLLKEK